jgi:DnaJ-class molecular chaperone
MGAFIVVVVVLCGAGYYASLRIWPETSCRRCGGNGRNVGSNARRFGRCKRCGGSGRKPRLGNRMLGRKRRRADD